MRLRACTSGVYAPIGRSMNAPFGIDARRLRNRSWLAGEVGNRKRTDVPSFMSSCPSGGARPLGIAYHDSVGARGLTAVPLPSLHGRRIAAPTALADSPVHDHRDRRIIGELVLQVGEERRGRSWDDDHDLLSHVALASRHDPDSSP